MPSFAPELLIVLLLIVLNGAFAMSEMAIVSSRKARLQQMAANGDRGARIALELANDPNQLLSTIQIGITLIGIINGAFGGAALSTAIAQIIERVPLLAPYSAGIGFGLVVTVITYLSLVVGELVPKRLALSNPERVAVIVAAPMLFLSTLARPIVRVLSASNDLLLRLLGARPSDDAPVTEDEIKILIQQGTRAGVFHEEELELVERIFRLGDDHADDIMTPRHDVVWLEVEAPLATARQAILETDHAVFPVGRVSLDDVVGIVQATAILAHDQSADPPALASLVEPAVFIPETMHAFRVIEMLRTSRPRLVIVVDEYGGMQGIVTPGDVLAAIVGDITSTSDEDEALVHALGDGSWSVDAALPVEEWEAVTGSSWPHEEHAGYRSLGGFMMAQLKRLPAVGDTVERDGWRFEVVEMARHRVSRLLVLEPGTLASQPAHDGSAGTGSPDERDSSSVG